MLILPLNLGVPANRTEGQTFGSAGKGILWMLTQFANETGGFATGRPEVCPTKVAESRRAHPNVGGILLLEKGITAIKGLEKFVAFLRIQSGTGKMVK